MIKASIVLLGILFLAPEVNAALVVTSATVIHRRNSVETVVLDSTSIGNSFNTFDGRIGAILDIGATTGSLRISTSAEHNPPPAIGYTWYTTRGTVRFSSIGGDFSVSPDLYYGSSFGIRFRVRNLDTQAYASYIVNYGPPDPGTLTFPAPAGNYELTWDSGQYTVFGTSIGGTGTLNFAITPEPNVLFAGVGAITVALRRRRVG